MSRFERWSRAKRGLSVDEEPSPDGEGSRHTDVDNAPTQELDEPSVAECATDAHRARCNRQLTIADAVLYA